MICCLTAAAGAIVWLVAARSLSELIDRWHTVRLSETPVRAIRFDNGVVEVDGVRLDALTTGSMPSGLGAVLGAGGRVLLQYQGQAFPCGPGRSLASASGLPDLTVSPDSGDTVTFSREQSYLSWPTPLEMNFMTGSAASWRRHLYCRLVWRKRSGTRLEIVWRFTQGLFREDGWRPRTIEFGSAGLLRVRMAEGAELQNAAVAYLTRTRRWQRADYRLESRGPSSDGSGEVMAAIHRSDERTGAPGSGLSVGLVLDYNSRQVVREIAFQ